MFKRSVILILVLSLCLSTASFAKKPIKLTEKEMTEIYGAFVPGLIYVALAAGLLMAQGATYMTSHNANVEYIKENPEAAQCPAPPYYSEGSKAGKMVGSGELSKDDPACQAYHDTSKKIFASEFEKETAIALVTLVGGELVEPVCIGLGQVKFVKGAASGLQAASPTLYGLSKPLGTATVKYALTDIPECAIDKRLDLNRTGQCSAQKYGETVSSPFLWLQMGAGATESKYGSMTGQGYEGYPLPIASEVKGVTDNLYGVSEKFGEMNEFNQKLIGSKSGDTSNDPKKDRDNDQKNDLGNNWIVNPNDLKANQTINPNDTLTQLQNTYTGQVVQVGNDLFYELGDKITTYQVDVKTYDIVFDKGGNPTCGYDSGSSHHDPDDDDDKPSPGPSPSPSPSPSPTPSKVIKSSTPYTGPTLSDAKSAIDKISKGATVKDLSDNEKAFISSH